MLTLLAESDPDLTAAKWYWGVALIMVIGACAVLLFVVLAISRRWAQRQHAAIDQERAARREMRSAERVDTWRASAERYVDQDKLPDETPGQASDQPEGPDDDELDMPSHGRASYEDGEEVRDPYGLFDSMPYEEPDDEDDDDEGPDEDFGEDFDDDDFK